MGHPETTTKQYASQSRLQRGSCELGAGHRYSAQNCHPMNAKWSILCLTQPSRERFLARISAVLKPQLEEYSDVEFKTRLFDQRMDLGTNRQAMIEASSAEYISQVDDDDLVPASYVSTIYPLLDGVDYVGFRLQLYVDGEKQKPTYHSLQYKEWNADQDGFYRDISHLNPIRRELALQAKMSGGFGEDERWSTQLRNLGIVKTEHYIPEVMYFYFYRGSKTDHVQPVDQIRRTNLPDLLVGQRLPVCPKCGSTATGLAGGMRRCNQCGESWF